MDISKKDITRLLESIAVYMEIKGENSFKIQAFRRAAQALETSSQQLHEIKDFTSISGIGKTTASVIEEYFQSGKSTLLKQLQSEIPKGLIFLLQIPGLGGKTIAKLYQELGIENVEALKAACENGEVRHLSGFGEKKEAKILESINSIQNKSDRLPLAVMLPYCEWVEEQSLKFEDIEKFSRAGSIRRVNETIKDLDFIIATNHPEKVQQQLVNLPHIQKVTNQGITKVSCVFSFDATVSCDFRMVHPREFATALNHFTGSKVHNVKMRQIAKSRNEKINEYGVEQIETSSVLTFISEHDFYQHFGLPFIPPELREDGEEFNRIQEIDELVDVANIKGDLHMHSTWSDGAHQIEEMIEACIEKGYDYMAITDHSKFLKVANGLNRERLLKQNEHIQKLKDRYPEINLLSGIEMDILPNGSLDLDNDTLSQLDIVIASIHSGFSQSEDQIMERLKSAFYNPYVDIIAHPTGRKIGMRNGYSVNIDGLIQMAKETGTILELNANPRRLDLSIPYLIKAQENDVNLVINTDAHDKFALRQMEIGVKYARKAWIRKETVINTWSYEKLRDFLQKRKSKL